MRKRPESVVGRRESVVGSRESVVDNRLPTTDHRLPTTCGRAVIDEIRPVIDGGRFPIKRTPGEYVDVAAVLFADGHDVVVAVLRDRPALAKRLR